MTSASRWASQQPHTSSPLNPKSDYDAALASVLTSPSKQDVKKQVDSSEASLAADGDSDEEFVYTGEDQVTEGEALGQEAEAPAIDEAGYDEALHEVLGEERHNVEVEGHTLAPNGTDHSHVSL